MKKETIRIIITFVALTLSNLLHKLGFLLISYICSGVATITILTSALQNIKTVNERPFALAMSITLATGLVFLFTLFFMDRNIYLLYGSLICFILSFPLGVTIMHFYKKA